MCQAPRPFLAWPGAPHLLYAARLGLAVGLLFALVYYGCDRLTAARALRVPVHFSWELSLIPLRPAWAWVYHSINLLFLLTSFVLRDRREYAALAWAMAAAIGAAGLGFLLVPSQVAYAPVPPEAMTPALASVMNVSLSHNLAPSLHVALSLLCLSAYWDKARPPVRAALALWGAAIAASTLLTHQHHVVDVVTGAALAWACRGGVYRPLAAG